MTLNRVARLHPFLWLGAITLVIMALGGFMPLSYDDGGVGTAWFTFTYALTVVFRWASALVGAVTGSEQGAVSGILSIAIGCVPYIIADRLLFVAARRTDSAGSTV